MISSVAQGTRVVVIKEGGRRPGVVTGVRWEPYLRPYVVLCDDGTEVFVSAYHLARENDPTFSPVGPEIEY